MEELFEIESNYAYSHAYVGNRGVFRVAVVYVDCCGAKKWVYVNNVPSSTDEPAIEALSN
jgi:hypothetical protein